MRALMHSNMLLREFALMSMWRIPKLPVAAHKLLGFLAEPLKQLTEETLEEFEISENLQEFEDWREITLAMHSIGNGSSWSWRSLRLHQVIFLLKKQKMWLQQPTKHTCFSLLLRWESDKERLHKYARIWIEHKGHSIERWSRDSFDSMHKEHWLASLSLEVVLRCLAADGDGIGFHMTDDGGLLVAIMAAGFKGELSLFQAGLTMEISRLDAWFSDFDGCLRKEPATYIVQGLYRRCCLPEIILSCMQLSVSLSAFGSPPDNHDKLIELAASPECGFSFLFS